MSQSPLAPMSGIEQPMKRGHLFLEDKDWKQAEEYFDKALDIDPEHAPAYIGKLCAALHLKYEEHLTQAKELLANFGHYQKAIRFASEDYRAKLEGYNKNLQECLEQDERERIEAEKQNRERDEKTSRRSKTDAKRDTSHAHHRHAPFRCRPVQDSQRRIARHTRRKQSGSPGRIYQSSRRKHFQRPLFVQKN